MNKKVPITVVISAYNEEKKLSDCLESVKWADEIIVIDNTSTDRTAHIAKKYTDHVLMRENNLMLNINKNYGFSKAKNDWILSLDADERITPELAEELASLVENKGDEINGYLIPRKNIIFGKWIQNSIWWPDYQLRLFRKGRGKFAEKHVHELLTLEGEPGKTQHPMLHLNYETVSQFLYKLDKIYTESEVKNFIESGKELHWFDAIRMPTSDFLKTFFLQKGYKDGLHGLVLSLLQAFYAEIVFAKIWEKQGFKEYNTEDFVKNVVKELEHTSQEFRYWIYTMLLDEAKDSAIKLYYKVMRKKAVQQLKRMKI